MKTSLDCTIFHMSIFHVPYFIFGLKIYNLRATKMIPVLWENP